MAVDESVDTYSTAAASNTPADSDTVGPDLDNHLRDIKKNIRTIAESTQSPSSPTGFRGRVWLDTSGTGTNTLTLNIYDGGSYRPLLDIDTSSGAITPYVNTATMPAYGKTLATEASTGSARSSLGLSTIVEVGKQTYWVPAGGLQPTVSEGCAPIVSVELTTGRPNMRVLDFDASSTERAQFQVAFPKSWNEGPVTAKVFAVSSVTSGAKAVFGIKGVAVSDNDPMDATFGTAVLITASATTAINDLLTTPESASATLGGSPAEGDLAVFEIYRDVGNASDTLTGDARVQGVHIYFRTDAGNDD